MAVCISRCPSNNLQSVWFTVTFTAVTVSAPIYFINRWVFHNIPVVAALKLDGNGMSHFAFTGAGGRAGEVRVKAALFFNHTHFFCLLHHLPSDLSTSTKTLQLVQQAKRLDRMTQYYLGLMVKKVFYQTQHKWGWFLNPLGRREWVVWYTDVYMRHNTVSFGNWIRSCYNTQTLKRRWRQVIGAIYTDVDTF